jgi:diguanylate cyclase (GGDEF)-like protein
MVKLRLSVPLRLLLPLILAGVLAIGGLIVITIENRSLRQEAILEAKAKADLLLARDQATSAFITHESVPNPNNLENASSLQPNSLDMISSSHVTTQINHYFNQFKPADIYVKEVTINARLSQNEADSLEKAYLEKVQAGKTIKPEAMVTTIDGNPFYVVMQPGQVAQENCLVCHGDPQKAPQALIDTYGPVKGFNWKAGEVISISSVRVPLAGPYATADDLSFRISILLTIVLIGMFISQVIFTRRLLLKPVEQIQDAASRIAFDEERLGEQVNVRFGQELVSLAQAFNKMSANLRRMRNSLEERVQDRTAMLSQANADLEREVEIRSKAEKQLNEQKVLAEALRDTSLALNSTLDLQGVIRRILNNLNRVIPHDAANVMAVDDGIAYVVDCQGYDAFGITDYVRSIRWKVTNVPNYLRMAETGQPAITVDTHNEKGWVHTAEIDWLRSYIGAPIMLKGSLVGFINIDSATPGFFNESQIETLQIFANQAATAISNARAYDSMRQYLNEISALYNASDALLASGEGVEKLAEQIVIMMVQQFNTSYATLMIVDEQRQELRLLAAFGAGEKEQAPLRLDGEGISVRAYREKAVQYVTDVSVDAEYVVWNPDTAAEMAIPLLVENRVAAVLNLESSNVNGFDERWRRVMIIFASRAALAFENALLQAEVKEYSITDPLTGLYNRRGLGEMTSHEIERANRLGEPISVLVIDVDHFKSINDNLGHSAGDQVLAAMASRLKTTLRKMDVIGRTGGDEFVVLLPGIAEEGIDVVSDRLREAVAGAPIETGEDRITVTISIGGATLAEGETNLADIARHADEALIIAKRAGRNQFHVWKGDEGDIRQAG